MGEPVNKRAQVAKQEILDHVDEQVKSGWQDLTNVVKGKADIVLVDLRLQTLQHEVTEMVTRIGKTKHAKSPEEDDKHSQLERKEWMESEMERRMRVVRQELIKLVDSKADPDQVDQRVQTMQHELADHLHQRVHAVREELSEQIHQCEQATEELTEVVSQKADVEHLN